VSIYSIFVSVHCFCQPMTFYFCQHKNVLCHSSNRLHKETRILCEKPVKQHKMFVYLPMYYCVFAKARTSDHARWQRVK
jgi:hypothetical protein